jgi:heme exporter protein B
VRRLHDAPGGCDRRRGAGDRALILASLRVVLRRDLLLALRRPGDVATALLFFVIVASLFPLGIGAEPERLRSIAPGVIWVAALLSSMLSLARLFAADHADGTLEQMLIGAAPLGVVVAAKTLAHWLVSGLPLVLIAPLIALQYDVAAPLYGVLALSLLLGTPVLSFIGAIGAALTLGLRGGGVLVALLVLPLYVPVLILGAGAVAMAEAGLSAEGQLELLGALLVVAAAFAPWASAAALRISSE